jgi:hypothetical protein
MRQANVDKARRWQRANGSRATARATLQKSIAGAHSGHLSQPSQPRTIFKWFIRAPYQVRVVAAVCGSTAMIATRCSRNESSAQLCEPSLVQLSELIVRTVASSVIS